MIPLTPEERRAIETADPYMRDLLAWRLSWIETARSKQLPPWEQLSWNVWLALAGRGFGKTRVGAEETGFNACAAGQTRWAVVAPTQNDVRSVCFEGDSGLLRVIPKRFVRSYNSQALEIHLENKSIIQGFSAEKPDRLRGPQFHGGWGDEVASWGASAGKGGANNSRLQDTWDNLNFCLRLGQRPRLILTTTPRPIDFLRTLVKDPTTITITGSTFENTKLAPSALETFKRIYEGTRRGRQELYAEILEQAEGALWNVALIEPHRVSDFDGRHVTLRDGNYVEIERIAVAIDPAITVSEQSDETGIIVAGLGADGRIYVLDDASGKYSPSQWARTAMSLYERYKADCIVAEVNQGGDLVTETLRAVGGDSLARIKTVHAKRGKYLRAEPIAAYYEKGLVSHAGYFGPLEKQMLSFQGFTGENSPDRLDALVYAIGELMLGTVNHAFW